MTFLNASLIFGTLAIAVPIVLHFIARREPRQIVFPSVRLLVRRVESNRSKLRIRRWWLLALRILALAVLAIALARPAIHRALSMTWLTIGLLAVIGVALLVMASVALARNQGRATAMGLGIGAAALLAIASIWGIYTAASGARPSIDNSQPVALAIVLDNSPTSAWQTPDDDRITRLRAVADELIATLPATSRIAVIDRSSTPAAFSLDIASAVSKVAQLRPLEITQPIESRLDAAKRLLETSDLSMRHVVLVTDLSTSTYDANTDKSVNSGDSTDTVPALVGQFGGDSAIGLSVMDLGEFRGNNRSLSLPVISDQTPPPGSPVPISTTIAVDPLSPASADEAPPQDTDATQSVTVELQLYQNDPSLPVLRDGRIVRPATKSVDRRSVEVSINQPVEIRLTVPPLQSGQHHGVVRLIGGDAMPLDDAAYFTLNVLPPISLLLVGNDDDESSVISDVITATPGPDAPVPEYAIQRISYADLPVARLSDFPAIILLDPPRETLADDSLQDFVASGGNVFVCLGESVGNDPLSVPYLPELVRRWRVPRPGSFLQTINASHPVLAIFEDLSGGVPWSDFRIHQYWQIKRRTNDQVLMRMAGTEHPALLETSPTDGSGRWLILTTPLPDLAGKFAKWNELFSSEEAWPAFVLVRSIAQRICGRDETNSTSAVGSAASLRVSIPDSQQTNAETVRMQLFPPGDSVPVPIDVAISGADTQITETKESTDAAANSRSVVIRDVSRSGTYWLRGPGTQTGFSANLSRDRISTQRIDVTALDKRFGADAYDIIQSVDEIAWRDRQNQDRVLLRSPLMLLALAVFLLEQLLGNRFYSGSSTAGRTSGEPRKAAA
ncbi:BatA domain-containing protein [Stieleria varia]|uniref:Aerotolerance regulator N-terminal domain-containing protein n=1 Tax=Stieleria varia TaxID=2528005 RepID=A0A5C6A074_9BACT|nr:BatA domain-containing protein [Stieleria varia]TWT93222.1 hypothetical protein Pla52n_58790 [Stieleria varia]